MVLPQTSVYCVFSSPSVLSDYYFYIVHKKALTVGASKADDSKAWFSRYGICVDISAPGYDIRTTSKKGDDEFLYARGTSLSCPFVAGKKSLIIFF